MATAPAGSSSSSNAAAAAAAQRAREAAERARRLAEQRAEAARRQAERAKQAQARAAEARAKAQATQKRLNEAKKPQLQKQLKTRLEAEKKEVLASRKAALQETAKAQRALATAERTVNSAEAKAKTHAAKANICTPNDEFEKLGAKNQRTFDRLFGAQKNEAAETAVKGLAAVNAKAEVTDTQVEHLKAALATDGSGDSRVAAAKKLEETVAALPDQASRTTLLSKLKPELQEISRGANGTPDEDDRQAILGSLVNLSEGAGPAGAQHVASAFADVAVNDHTDVDNGDQLGGALKSVINDSGDADIFGVALGNELGNREGLDEVRDNVRLGVYEAIHDKNPSKLDRIVDDIGAAWDEVKDFAAEKYLSVFNPATDALGKEIDQLGPNDRFQVNIGADVKAVLGVQVDLGLDVTKKETGEYTVGFTGRVEGEFGAKLKGKLPFLDKALGSLGADAEANVHGAVRAEFTFASKDEAKHGANTIARTTISAAAPPTLAVTALAEAETDGYSNLASHVSAVEASVGVGSAVTGSTSVKGTGFDTSLAANVDAKLRLEFQDGKPAVLSQILQGTVAASATTDGSAPKAKGAEVSKTTDVFSLLARGDADGLVKLENRVRITDPDNFAAGSLLRSKSVETVLFVQGTAAGGLSFGGARGNAKHSAQGANGARLSAELRGSPGDLAQLSAAVLGGDAKQVRDVLARTQETVKVAPIAIESTRHSLALGPAEVYFATRSEDLGRYRTIIKG